MASYTTDLCDFLSDQLAGPPFIIDREFGRNKFTHSHRYIDNWSILIGHMRYFYAAAKDRLLPVSYCPNFFYLINNITPTAPCPSPEDSDVLTFWSDIISTDNVENYSNVGCNQF